MSRWILTILMLSVGVVFGANQYITLFPNSENPISEGGRFLNMVATGIKWSNCVETVGFCYGGTDGSVNYTDPSAIMTGSWGATQKVQATVKIRATDNSHEREVGLRVRTTVTANNTTGYEFNYNADPDLSYFQIVRWNGALGNFTLIGTAPSGLVADGDIITGDISGNNLTMRRNGSIVVTATDSTYGSGNPGFSFYLNNDLGGGYATNFGFTEFVASDGADPFIMTQPQNQSVNIGDSATFTIVTGGFTPRTKQWKFNGSNVGIDSDTYVRSNCQLADTGGSVTCVVTDTASNVTSSAATLTVTGSSTIIPTVVLSRGRIRENSRMRVNQ